MPRYLTEKTAYIGGAVRQEGEEFYVEKPVTTRAPLNKNGKRTGKKAPLPEWLKPVDQSAKEAAADKDAASADKEAKQKEAEEQEKELKAAGVDSATKNDFMSGDGKVEQM